MIGHVTLLNFPTNSLNIHILVIRINTEVRLGNLAYREKKTIGNVKSRSEQTLMNRRNLHLDFDNLRQVQGKG